MRLAAGRGEVTVLPAPDALMRAAAERFVAAAAAAIGDHGRFVVALAGGDTPKPCYALLATEPYASRVDWSRVEVFWCDERSVPPQHPASNYLMARETLLDRVPVRAKHVHRIHGEDEPAAAAEAYERDLRGRFRTPEGPPRSTPDERFDLVLLGLGTDGHTASIFPGSTALGETGRWVTAERAGQPPGWRVTLTPVVINAAAEILFLVTGPEKAAALHRVLDGPRQPDALPAQAIAPRAGLLRWWVDAAAAAELAARSHP